MEDPEGKKKEVEGRSWREGSEGRKRRRREDPGGRVQREKKEVEGRSWREGSEGRKRRWREDPGGRVQREERGGGRRKDIHKNCALFTLKEVCSNDLWH